MPRCRAMPLRAAFRHYFADIHYFRFLLMRCHIIIDYAIFAMAFAMPLIFADDLSFAMLSFAFHAAFIAAIFAFCHFRHAADAVFAA